MTVDFSVLLLASSLLTGLCALAALFLALGAWVTLKKSPQGFQTAPVMPKMSRKEQKAYEKEVNDLMDQFDDELYEEMQEDDRIWDMHDNDI